MKLTIESTQQLVDLDGVTCRAWTAGRGILVFVHRIAVPEAVAGELAELGELVEQRGPDVFEALKAVAGAAPHPAPVALCECGTSDGYPHDDDDEEQPCTRLCECGHTHNIHGATTRCMVGMASKTGNRCPCPGYRQVSVIDSQETASAVLRARQEIAELATEVVDLDRILDDLDDPPCKHGNDPVRCAWCASGEDPEDYA